MIKDFRFKDVDIIFNIKKLPQYDQEYLRTMVFETIGERSVKNTGRIYRDYYPNAKNFSLFNDHAIMLNYMSEFYDGYSCTISHLLHGKKYYFAWTHSG
tara:strand:- start:27 stop:323 length:297 start_codon:yes stop_codon:yes gene_type:complete